MKKKYDNKFVRTFFFTKALIVGGILGYAVYTIIAIASFKLFSFELPFYSELGVVGLGSLLAGIFYKHLYLYLV